MIRICLIGILVAALGGSAVGTANGAFPKPISSALPMYPERARTARIAGTVKVVFNVNATGEVSQPEAITGNPLLRASAEKAVATWKFEPKAMQPSARYETEFVYVLNVQQSKGEPKLTVSLTDFRRVEVASEVYVEVIE